MRFGWLLIPIAAWAVAQTARADDMQDARKALVDYVRPQVKTLSHEIHVFHWTNAFFGKALPPMGPELSNYVRYMIGTFRKEGQSMQAMGEGFYTAIDPVISRMYGEALLQIVIPKGTRYLHFEENEIAPADVTAIVKRAGCPDAPLNVTFAPSITFAVADIKECRELRDYLVKDLDLQAIGYTFDSYLPRLCGSTSKAAFVLFDERAVALDRIVGFRPGYVGNRIPLPPEDGHGENRLILDAIALRASTTEMFWELPAGVQPKTDIDAWMRENLFGCDGVDH